MGRAVGLVDERGRRAGHRSRAAGAAPRLPGDLAVEDRVEGRVTGGEGAVGDDVQARRAGRSRPAVRPHHHVVVDDLALVGDRVPAGSAELGRCADLDPAERRRRGRRAVARRPVPGREDGRRPRTQVPDVGLLARRVEAVVVDGGVAVRVRRHVDAVARREEVAELGRELEREVDVAERRQLGLRCATDHGARIRAAALAAVTAGLGTGSAAEILEARRQAVDHALADDVDAVSVPWPSIPGS